MNRRSEMAPRVERVRERIASACAQAGREPDEVTLIAVTKTFPASDVVALTELGIRDFGENRLPELRDKVEALARPDLRWHFIGQVQTKKAGQVSAVADTVHSVDRERLVQSLARGAQRHGRRLGVFLQVSLDHLTASTSPTGIGPRGGIEPAGLLGLAAVVAESQSLDLSGIMCLPPPDLAPEVAFAELSRLSGQLTREHPTATAISAGMSGDLEVAVRHGATHVRIGTAILGARPVVG